MGWGGEEDTLGETLFSSFLTLPVVLRLVIRHEYVQTCRILPPCLAALGFYPRAAQELATQSKCTFSYLFRFNNKFFLEFNSMRKMLFYYLNREPSLFFLIPHDAQNELNLVFNNNTCPPLVLGIMMSASFSIVLDASTFILRWLKSFLEVHSVFYYTFNKAIKIIMD